jgi:hypothetical protein
MKGEVMEKIDKLSAGYTLSGVIGKQGEPLSFQPHSTESKVNELVDAVNALVDKIDPVIVRDAPYSSNRTYVSIGCVRCGERINGDSRDHVCEDLKKTVNGKCTVQKPSIPDPFYGPGHFWCGLCGKIKADDVLIDNNAHRFHVYLNDRHVVEWVEDKPEPKEALTPDWDKPGPEEPIDIIATLKHVKFHLIGYHDAESAHDTDRAIEYLEGIEERKREVLFKIYHDNDLTCIALAEAIKKI